MKKLIEFERGIIMYRTDRYHRESRIVKYFRRTWKNKVCALALLVPNYYLAKWVGDATGLVVLAMFAIPMFFATSNWIKY